MVLKWSELSIQKIDNQVSLKPVSKLSQCIVTMPSITPLKISSKELIRLMKHFRRESARLMEGFQF
jgi:hypothetical protein